MSTNQASSNLAKRLDKLNEFERAPITQDRLHSGRYFAGLFAGEHVAATEFVIGALFVQWGAGAYDLVVGLLIGNALAVLSWVLICTPIAVQTRLTLYWYVRRIIGPGLTVIYNFMPVLDWVRTDMGGANGLIEADESISGMRQIIERFELSQTGSFIKYDGTAMPW